jgi:hypothetical protein
MQGPTIALWLIGSKSSKKYAEVKKYAVCRSMQKYARAQSFLAPTWHNSQCTCTFMERKIAQVLINKVNKRDRDAGLSAAPVLHPQQHWVMTVRTSE